MNIQFVKKASLYLCIIGAVAGVYNALICALFCRFTMINIITLALIIIMTGVIYLFGVKRQINIMPYLHIVITYLVIFACFYIDPENISGIVFTIINFLLLCEYKIIRETWHKIVAVVVYIIPILISILVLGNPVGEFLAHYLITIFFIFFLKMYIEHKQTEEFKQSAKAIKIIDELREDNRELLQIAKQQHGILNRQKDCLDSFPALM